MFKRNLKEPIERRLGKGKAIIIIGARQVGKTTLTKELIQRYDRNGVLILNGDTLEAQRLSKKDFPSLMEQFGQYECVLIDEAHKINRIGDIAKSIIDEFGKDIQLIMTGSSTVNLIDKTSEPLTGRKRVFELYPISLDEYLGGREDLEEEEFDLMLRYGMYPEVLNGEDELDKQDAIMELAESTLYRDILDVTGARASGDLVALLRYLAQNSAVRVNINDASKSLHIDRRHIEKYIDLLIKSFIIFPIFPITKGGNTRTVRKAYKIYFWDVGVRNALLGDFSPTHERPDAEQLWQNFVIAERMKRQNNNQEIVHHYYWRQYDGTEIPLVEVRNQKMNGYRLSRKEKAIMLPQSFEDLEPEIHEIVTHRHLVDFILNKWV